MEVVGLKAAVIRPLIKDEYVNIREVFPQVDPVLRWVKISSF